MIASLDFQDIVASCSKRVSFVHVTLVLSSMPSDSGS